MAHSSKVGAVRGWITAVVLTAAVVPRAAPAQAPLDVFGIHYGGARTPAIAPTSWLGFSSMLLTQLDGRWDETVNDGTFINYDDLTTTVGYNYLTAGHQFVFSNVLPRATAVTLATSVHGGVTYDAVPRWIQDRMHDFMQIPHVKREDVHDRELVLGVDVEALAWPGRRWFGIGPRLALGTHHREAGLTALARVPVWDLVVAGQLSGAVVGRSGVTPEPVGLRLDGDYWAGRLSIEYGETFGFSSTWSEGIFVGESEWLFVGYFAAQLSPTHWVRLEFLNDLLNDKDRGPTGGGRLVWTIRY